MTRPNVPVLFASACACVCAALLLAGAAQAQMYRHIGPDGRVTYSDRPPVFGARPISTIGPEDSPADTGLPYQIHQIAQSYPVTLYTSSGCEACNAGRSLLIHRGIPFHEKTVQSNDDITALRQLSGGNSLPVLTIGEQRLSGYSDQDWNRYLDAAGYPKTSQLPDTYQRPPATPLAAAPQPEASTAVPAVAPQPEASTAAPAIVPQPEASTAAPAVAPEPEASAAAPAVAPEPEASVAAPAEAPQPEAFVAAPAEAPQPEAPVAVPADAPQPEASVAAPAEAPQPEASATVPADAPQPDASAPAPAQLLEPRITSVPDSNSP